MNFEQVINAAIHNATLKGALAIIFGWVFSLFLPIAKFFVLVVLLLSSDFVTGIWASRSEGKLITSKRMGGTIVKFVVYSLAIVLSYAVQIVFQAENILQGLPLTYWVAFFICLTELKSNFENIERISGVNILGYLSILKLFKPKIK